MSALPIGTEAIIATDAELTNIAKHYNSSYLTSLDILHGELPKGQDLYAKMRHDDQWAGWTPWSPIINFSIADYQKYMAYIADGSTSISIRRSDNSGNLLLYNWGGSNNAPVFILNDLTTLSGFTSGIAHHYDMDLNGNTYTISNDTNPIISKRLAGIDSPIWSKQLTNIQYASGWVSPQVKVNLTTVAVFGRMSDDSKTYLVVFLSASTGEVTAVAKITSPWQINPYGFEIDSDSNVYLTGFYRYNTSYLRAFLLKIAPTGELLWSRARNSTSSFGTQILIYDDAIYVNGLNGSSLSKWSPTGDLIWIKPYYIFSTSMVGDNNQNLYLTAYTAATSYYILKIDKDANILAAYKLTKDGTPLYPTGAAIDKKTTTIYFSGYFSGTNGIYIFGTSPEGPSMRVVPGDTTLSFTDITGSATWSTGTPPDAVTCDMTVTATTISTIITSANATDATLTAGTFPTVTRYSL